MIPGHRMTPPLLTEHMHSRRRVHIAIGTSAQYQRQTIEGIIRFAHTHAPHWELQFTRREGPLTSLGSATLPPDGIIAYLDWREPRMLDVLRALKVPTVLIEDLQRTEFPAVCGDNHAIGRLAFDHLHGKGFARFVFAGPTSVAVFRERQSAFEQAVRDAELELLPAPPMESWNREAEHDPAAQAWLREAGKPLALFAGTVELARRIVTLCRTVGVLVPDEVAVLGVDNEILECEMSQPPLSTIDHGLDRAGFEGAALLERLFNGDAPPTEPIRIAPIGVIERQSTDTLAVGDPDVRSALRYIREHATDGINVKELLERLPLNRRKLEAGFRKHLGRGIYSELTRVRLDRAKLLLRTTEMAMPKIAAASGFEYASRLSALFVQVVGMTPSAYRRQQRSA
jgi:LacI family transcriptional regulator